MMGLFAGRWRQYIFGTGTGRVLGFMRVAVVALPLDLS